MTNKRKDGWQKAYHITWTFLGIILIFFLIFLVFMFIMMSGMISSFTESFPTFPDLGSNIGGNGR